MNERNQVLTIAETNDAHGCDICGLPGRMRIDFGDGEKTVDVCKQRECVLDALEKHAARVRWE